MTNKRQKFEPQMTNAVVKKHQSTIKKVLSWSLQLILGVLIYLVAQWWQQRNMLSSSGEQQLPKFNLPTLSGEVSSYQRDANKPALVYFFAPWCTVCHLSIENLNTLQELVENKHIDLFIIALDYSSLEEVRTFVSEHQLPAKVLLGTAQQQRDFQVYGFPSYYLADAKGIIIWSSIGYSTQLGLDMRVALTLSN